MTEYNIYAIDSNQTKHYLYTTITDKNVIKELDVLFLKDACKFKPIEFYIVETSFDNLDRDELILDYIIENEDSSS